MAQRAVTVEIIAKYKVDVMADSGIEAQKKAKELVRTSTVKPIEMDAIIMDVRLPAAPKEDA